MRNSVRKQANLIVKPQINSMCHSITSTSIKSVLEMFLPLFRGAGLVMVNQSTQKDPFHLLDVIRDLKVTVMQATPTTFEVR